MNFLERWETVDIARVETLRLSSLVSISTRGNGSGQVGLVFITRSGVADGKRVTTSPDISPKAIRSETVGPGVEASFWVLPLSLKKHLTTIEIIDKSRAMVNHFEMNGLLRNAPPSSTGVGNEGGSGGGAPSSSRTCSLSMSTAMSKYKMGKSRKRSKTRTGGGWPPEPENSSAESSLGGVESRLWGSREKSLLSELAEDGEDQEAPCRWCWKARTVPTKASIVQAITPNTGEKEDCSWKIWTGVGTDFTTVTAVATVGRCMSPDGGMNVLFNGGFENDNPYNKGDIGHDTGQTRLSKVDAFSGR